MSKAYYDTADLCVECLAAAGNGDHATVMLKLIRMNTILAKVSMDGRRTHVKKRKAKLAALVTA